jgi:hypothetical protein
LTEAAAAEKAVKNGDQIANSTRPHAAKSTIVRGVLKKKLAQLGAYPHPMTPDEVTRFAVGQQRTWKPIVEKVAKR